VGKVQEYIDVIDKNFGEFIDTVSALPQDLVQWKPAEDKWSVHEVVAHVEEAIPYWMNELENIVYKKEAEWGRNHLHEGRLEAVARAGERSTSEILESIKQARVKTREILEKMTDADLAIEAPSRNPRWGVKPMSFMLDHLVVEHLDVHTKQVKRNISQYSA